MVVSEIAVVLRSTESIHARCLHEWQQVHWHLVEDMVCFMRCAMHKAASAVHSHRETGIASRNVPWTCRIFEICWYYQSSSTCANVAVNGRAHKRNVTVWIRSTMTCCGMSKLASGPCNSSSSYCYIISNCAQNCLLSRESDHPHIIWLLILYSDQ